MKALAIAATGMNAQQTNLEVIANNIANINTTGFKRARAEFSDLLYQTERLQGVPNRANQNIVPEGASIGLGVKTTAIRNLHIQGALTSTGNKFDLALTGNGWFQIEGADGETLYTRAGAFNTNANGDLVTADGYSVQPAITVPADAVEVIVNKTGQVFARIDGQADLQELGQLHARELRQRGRPRAARRQSVPGDRRLRRRPMSACPAIRASPRSSRAISRTPTSIRSRKSPS